MTKRERKYHFETRVRFDYYYDTDKQEPSFKKVIMVRRIRKRDRKFKSTFIRLNINNETNLKPTSTYKHPLPVK